MKPKQKHIHRPCLVIPLSITFCLLFSVHASAQRLIQTMTEQIAKFEIYLNYLKKGYNIVNEGLTFIGEIKKGDLNMHTNYFNSLETVNPAVKKYDKVGAIIAMQLKILSDNKTFMTAFKNSGTLSSSEMNYLSSVYSTLMSDLESDLGDLANIITDGQLQMKDNERLDRIDNLYFKFSNKYDFFYSFSSETNTQVLQRLKSLNEIQNLKKIYLP
jgi:hypothetical protein